MLTLFLVLHNKKSSFVRQNDSAFVTFSVMVQTAEGQKTQEICPLFILLLHLGQLLHSFWLRLKQKPLSFTVLSSVMCF